ncbi:MAG: hypothetical protein ABIN58_02885 [candidate division WOR-3 bacterium]
MSDRKVNVVLAIAWFQLGPGFPDLLDRESRREWAELIMKLDKEMVSGVNELVAKMGTARIERHGVIGPTVMTCDEKKLGDKLMALELFTQLPGIENPLQPGAKWPLLSGWPKGKWAQLLAKRMASLQPGRPAKIDGQKLKDEYEVRKESFKRTKQYLRQMTEIGIRNLEDEMTREFGTGVVNVIDRMTGKDFRALCRDGPKAARRLKKAALKWMPSDAAKLSLALDYGIMAEDEENVVGINRAHQRLKKPSRVEAKSESLN